MTKNNPKIIFCDIIPLDWIAICIYFDHSYKRNPDGRKTISLHLFTSLFTCKKSLRVIHNKEYTLMFSY